MSVLIHGLEMPQEGFVEVLIRDDGTVQQTGQSYRIDGTDYYTPYIGEMPVIYKAIPVPPHGRLIDADALIGKLHDECLFDYDARSVVYADIQSAPTILPASEVGET